MKIKVQATARVLGMRAGQVALVDPSPYVDLLVNNGWLTWLDRPLEPVQVTPAPFSEKSPYNLGGRRSNKPVEILAPEPLDEETTEKNKEEV